MSKDFKRKYKAFYDAHGRVPVTRRDFLGAGLISFSASLTVPSLIHLLASQQAYAQSSNCPSSSGGSDLAPFISLNLSGGAMLAANFVPMDQGLQPLPSYDKMGLGNGAVPIVREFGNVPFAGNGISKFLTALQAAAQATTIAKTAFVAIPTRSRDDSGDNKSDISGMVAKAGRVGQSLPNLGQADTDTGVRSLFAYVKPPNPLRVRSYNDIQGALGGAGVGALSTLSTGQTVSLLRLVKNLNDRQIAEVANNSGGDTLGKLVSCSSGQNVNLAAQPKPVLDARQSADMRAVWGFAANANQGDAQVVMASMTQAALIGAAGTVSIELGGFDYHNNTRATGDGKDAEAGRTVGRLIESAARANKPLFIYVTSDGACSSPASQDRAAPWNSDRGSAGVAFIIAYHPAGRPATSKFQIGQFTAAQAADDKFVTGGNPAIAGAAAFANYLQFNKRLSLMSSIAPDALNSTQLGQVIAFG